MYKVIKDTREQEDGGGWDFSPTANCAGTVIQTLKTGDYTIEGFEDVFVIERKGQISEFAHNITEARFERELQRLEAFRWPFIILEFSMEDVLNWPQSSNIPKSKQKDVRTNKWFILRRMHEIMIKYKTKIILAGKGRGKEVAASLFKRIIEHGKD